MLLLAGRIVTNIGDSLYLIAAMWLVLDLGGSAFYTGLAGFLTTLPSTLQFLAGPLVDKYDKKKIMVISQICQLVLILSIPILYYVGWLNITLVLIIMPILSLMEQLTYPAQTSLIPIIVKNEQLASANSLMTFAFRSVDMISRGLAGAMIVMFGAINIYILDSFTFVITIVLFSMMKLQKSSDSRKEKVSIKQVAINYSNDLKQGFNFIKGTIIMNMFLGAILANFIFGMAFAILPIFSNEHGGADTYGYLLAAFSFGFLAGAVMAPKFRNFRLGMITIILYLIATLFWVGSVMLISYSTLLGVLFFSLATIPLGISEILLSTVGQMLIPPRLMGRVFSIITSVSALSYPLGSLSGGLLGIYFSPTLIFALGGLGLFAISTIWLIFSRLRNLPKPSDIQLTKNEITKSIS